MSIMGMRVLVLTVLCAAVPAIGRAQTVELMFTPGVVQQAVALKGALKVEKIESFSALALVGVSAERKKAYADKVASTTAVVIVGEDAMKAAADVEFSVPLIVVNANGRTAARNRVIRVFDGSVPPPAGVTPVFAGDSIAQLIGTNRIVLLKGPVAPIVQALLVALK
jgi:hypothetical protein